MNEEVKEQAKIQIYQELDEIVVDYNHPRGTPDKDKIGRRAAFPRWFINKFYPLEKESDVETAISVGQGGDYECDFFFHFNPNGPREDQIIVWGQAKFGDNFDYNFEDDKFSRLIRVEDRFFYPPTDANEDFKKAADAFRKLHPQNTDNVYLPESPIRKEMVIVLGGKVNPQVRNQVEGDWYNTWRQTVDGEGQKTVRVIETEDLLRRIILPETPEQAIKFSEPNGPIQKQDLRTSNMSYIGHITGNDLMKLYKDVGDTLFLENPRRYLGEKGHTNKAIKRTLEDPDEKKQFWKLNNGITATCNEINEQDNGSFLVYNLKIVNGQQTTTTIAENGMLIDEDVEVGLKIHVSTDPDERKRISTSTNRQNALKAYDLMYLIGGDVNEHSQLYLDCENNYRRYYYEKQTAGYKSEINTRTANVTKRRVLEKAPTAIAKYAFSVNPYQAIKLGKLKIFNEDQPDDYLKVFFDEVHRCNTTCVHQTYEGYQHEETNGVKRFYKVKNIKELIIAHIFFSLLKKSSAIWVALAKEYQDWVNAGQTVANPVTGNSMWMTDHDTTRRFGLAARADHVRYYLLYWIHQSLTSFDAATKTQVENYLIEKFGNIVSTTDDIPDELLAIPKATVRDFFGCYDDNPALTWPEINGVRVTPDAKYMVTKLGESNHTEAFETTRIRIHANESARAAAAGTIDPEGDLIKTVLRALIPAPANNP